MEPSYTIKEIMELQFKGIDHKMDSILATLRDQNIHTEKRFSHNGNIYLAKGVTSAVDWVQVNN